MEFKVTLINKEDFERKNLFTRIGEFACLCYDTPLSKAEAVGKHCVKSGHLSGSRHVYYAFHLDSIRSVNDQLVRHQDGVVKNMQSQRYVNKSNFDYYTSSDIEANLQAKETVGATTTPPALGDINSIYTFGEVALTNTVIERTVGGGKYITLFAQIDASAPTQDYVFKFFIEYN